MKVVYLIPNNRISGGIIVVLQHMKNLEEMGHEVILVTRTIPRDWIGKKRYL
jgi:hypothetical protein